MHWTLGQLASVLGIDAPAEKGQLVVSSVVTDSRKIEPGCLFVALKGPNFDGHNFVARANELGAVAALVDAPLLMTCPSWYAPIHAWP